MKIKKPKKIKAARVVPELKMKPVKVSRPSAMPMAGGMGRGRRKKNDLMA
jgi:hypothetical protein